MAKMPASVISVRNLQNGEEYSCNVTQTPRKTEVGAYALAKLNTIGLGYIQKYLPDITSSETFEAWLAKQFGIPETGFGSLGAWKEAEDRNKWQVLINGVLFTEAVAPKVDASMVAPQVAPMIPQIPSLFPAVAPAKAAKTKKAKAHTVSSAIPMPPMPAAVADENKQRDEVNVGLVIKALQNQSAARDVVVALAKTYGNTQKAEEIYAEALKRMNAPVIPQAPAAPVFVFK